jgi:hypothetical protein
MSPFLDFLAHSFARTETIHNEKGEAITQPPKSFYKNGHFSLDLTFIALIVLVVILYFAFKRYKKFNKNQFLKMYELNNKRLQLNVERTPFGCVPQNCAVTQTGI